MNKHITLIVAITLLLITVYARAVIDEEHPYMPLVHNDEEAIAVYIGAYGDMAPAKISSGLVIVRELIKVTDPHNGSPAGQATEAIVIADCEKQIEKDIVIGYTPYEGANNVDMFPDFTTETVMPHIVDLLNQKPFSTIKPDSLMSLVVDAGCSYVDKDHKIPEHKPPKAPEIEI